MDGRTRLEAALEEMFRRRSRRVFLAGTTKFIWDYAILEHLLDPQVLTANAKGPSKGVLRSPILEVGATSAVEVTPDLTMREASEALMTGRGTCLCFENVVVTPWDVVMKPRLQGAFQISEPKRLDG